MRLGSLLVTLALGALVLGACGDDDDEDGEALSKSEYIAQADAICKRSNDEFDQLFETNFPVTQAAVPGFFERATAVIRKQMEDLRALEPPEADREEIDKLLATGDKVVDDFERASDDPEFGVQLFNTEGGDNSAAFDRQARAYGFKECGEEDEEDEEEEQRVDTSGFSAEKRAFIREADAVCRRSNERFSALEERYLESFPPPFEAWAEFLPRVADAARRSLSEFEAVPVPASERAAVDEFTSAQERLITQLEELAETAQGGDEAAFQQQAQEVFSASDELDAELREYGFRECGAEEDDE